MSCADTATAEKMTGLLEQEQAEILGSHDLKKAGRTSFQHGKGLEEANHKPSAWGFEPLTSVKDLVKEHMDHERN